MIQRIQSVYLLFASLVIFALFLFPLVHNVYVAGVPSTIKVTGIFQDVNGVQAHTQSFVALIAATAVAGIIPLLLIFLYKNRKQQIMLCYVYIVVIIGYSFWMAQTVKSFTGGAELNTNNFGIGALLSSLSIILVLGAAKAIQRDEKLVKSADRLR
jgi:predicted neutral ceramidase superfamily lipid hydrolase